MTGIRAHTKSFLALVAVCLAVCLYVSDAPIAQGVPYITQGDGSFDNPYVINNPTDSGQFNILSRMRDGRTNHHNFGDLATWQGIATFFQFNTGTENGRWRIALEGSPKIVDFDLAESDLSPVSVALGTPDSYIVGISPNQDYKFAVYRYGYSDENSGNYPDDPANEFGASYLRLELTSPWETPGAPTGLSVVNGNQEVTLSWNAPNNAAQSNITRYEISANDGRNAHNIGSDNTEFTIHTPSGVGRLQNNTNYNLRVRAVDSDLHGAGVWSNRIVGRPVASNSAPTVIPSTPGTTRGDREVILTWNALSTSVTFTEFQYSTDDGRTWSGIGNKNTTYTVRGLTNGTTYQFRIRTNNAGAYGPASRGRSIYPARLPDAPTNLRTTPGDGYVTLRWDAPVANHGSPITQYQYSFTSLHGQTVSWTRLNSSYANKDTSARVASLTNGSVYTFQVRAVIGINIDDETGGAASGSVVGTPSSVPGVVVNLQGTVGNARIKIEWEPPTTSGGSPITDYEYSAHITSTCGIDDSWVSVNEGNAVDAPLTTALTVTHITNEDQSALENGIRYYICVRAVNQIGAGNTRSVRLVPAAIPDPPTNLQAAAGNEEVTLTWDLPASDGGSIITNYEYRVDEGSWIIATYDPFATSHVVTEDLENATTYEFQVRANNINGSSEPSNSVFVRPRVIAGAPSNLQAVAGDRQVTLSWEAPILENIEIIEYQYTSSEDRGTWKGTGSRESVEYIVTGLTNGNKYTFWVRALTGEDRANSEATISSESVTVELPSSVPGKVLNLAGTSEYRAVRLMWDPPASDGGSDITHYEYSTNQSRDSWTDIGTTATAHTVTGLDGGQDYTFWVRAVNDVGTGIASDSFTQGVLGGVPGPPLNVQAVEGDSQVALSWDPPTSDGGSEITNYEYSYSSSVDVWYAIDFDDTRYTITGLSSNQEYTFWVRAVNYTGSGPPSDPAVVTVIGNVPTQVMGVQAVAGNESVILSWNANPETEDVSSYEYSTNEARDNWITVGDKITHVVTGLRNGTIYTFWLRAVNTVGASIASAPATTTPLGSTPGPITNLSATNGNGSIDIFWDPPIFDGGAIVSRYEWGVDGKWNSMGNASNSYTIDGLNNDDELELYVRAVNQYGVGDPGTFVNVTPSTLYPKRITNVTTSIGNGKVTLSWEEPESGDEPIEGYQYSIGSRVWYDIEAVENNYEIDGLINGIVYVFTLRAYNTNGPSSASDPIEAIPVATFLGAVQNLRGIPGNKKITLQWEPPVDGLVSKYEYKLDDGAWRSTGTLLSRHTISSLNNGQQYAISIRGINNDNGAGEIAVITITPNVTIPGHVPALNATIGNQKVTLSWRAPQSNGGAEITLYEYSIDNGKQWRTTEGADTSFVVDGLTNGETYEFQVRAVNRIGRGAPSLLVIAIPLSTPGAVTNLVASPQNTAVALSWSEVTTGGANLLRYEYSLNGGIWQPTDSISTSHTVDGLTNGTTYTFRVRGVNAVGDGTPSSSVTESPSATTTPTGRLTIAPAPLSEHENKFVREFCGRIPGCPASVIFLAPVIALTAAFLAGSKNPALLLGIGGGTMSLFMVILDPNIFTFLFVALVGLMSVVLWKFFR